MWTRVLPMIVLGCGRVDFAPTDTLQGPACGPAYEPVAGLSSLYRMAAARPWLEAEADCESDGGHLAVPELDAENAYLAAIAAESPETFIWIGLGDHRVEGTFTSVLGTTIALRFYVTEPNDANGLEDCVQIYATGPWNDALCTETLTYVCECDRAPLPAEPTYCDTLATESCGECDTPCAAPATCMDEVCN